MAEEFPGMDRRHFRRIRASISVVYRIDGPLSVRMVTKERAVEATMLDLSEGGLAIATDYNLPVSTLLVMRFSLITVNKYGVGSYGPVEIEGEVRDSSVTQEGLYRIGIAFSKVSDEAKGRIADFVRESKR